MNKPPQSLMHDRKKLLAALAVLKKERDSIPVDRARAIVETAYAAIDAIKFQHATQKGKP